MFVVFFFFSSRRRHTRFDCDWSSDVCSSDLRQPGGIVRTWQHIRCYGLARSSWAKRGSFRSSRHHQNMSPPRWKECEGLAATRSEEHTSELQSQSNLVCRLLLEKKKKKRKL